jgi:hypothetical protein
MIDSKGNIKNVSDKLTKNKEWKIYDK